MEQARAEGMQADAARLETLRTLGFGLHVEVRHRVVLYKFIGGSESGAGFYFLVLGCVFVFVLKQKQARVQQPVGVH